MANSKGGQRKDVYALAQKRYDFLLTLTCQEFEGDAVLNREKRKTKINEEPWRIDDNSKLDRTGISNT